MTHHRRPCTSANRRGSLPRQFGHPHHICIRQARRQGTSSTAANRKARECGLVSRFSTTFQSVAVLAFSGAHAGFPNRAPAGRSRESGAHQPTIRKDRKWMCRESARICTTPIATSHLRRGTSEEAEAPRHLTHHLVFSRSARRS